MNKKTLPSEHSHCSVYERDSPLSSVHNNLPLNRKNLPAIKKSKVRRVAEHINVEIVFFVSGEIFVATHPIAIAEGGFFSERTKNTKITSTVPRKITFSPDRLNTK